MKNLKVVVFFITVLILINSAAWAESFTLVTDEYWSSVIDAEIYDNPINSFIGSVLEILPFETPDNIEIEGEKIERRVVASSGTAEDLNLVKNACDGAERRIVISPLFARYACDAAEAFPEKLFFVPCSMIPEECGAENVFFFEYDYSDAFFQAGKWSAGRKLETTAVFFTEGEFYSSLRDSFINGWTEIKDIDELEIFEFKRLKAADSGFIDDYTEKLPVKDGLAVIFAGPKSDLFMTRADNKGNELLALHTRVWTELGLNCSASVELTPTDALSQIVKSAGAGNYKNDTNIEAEFFLHDRP